MFGLQGAIQETGPIIWLPVVLCLVYFAALSSIILLRKAARRYSNVLWSVAVCIPASGLFCAANRIIMMCKASEHAEVVNTRAFVFAGVEAAMYPLMLSIILFAPTILIGGVVLQWSKPSSTR